MDPVDDPGYAGPMSDLMDRVAAKAETDPDVRSILQALVGDEPDDPGAVTRRARLVNARRVQESWGAFAAAALRTPEVIDRLPSVTSRQGVNRMRQAGMLVGAVSGRDTYYPAWQFGPTGTRPDLDRILAALRAFTTDVVAQDRVMVLARDELGGLSVAETLDRRDRREAAWRVLDGLGDPR